MCTLGIKAQPLVMSVSLWGNRVEMMMRELGKDSDAFSATLQTRLPTFSCSSRRSLVPVWIGLVCQTQPGKGCGAHPLFWGTISWTLSSWEIVFALE